MALVGEDAGVRNAERSPRPPFRRRTATGAALGAVVGVTCVGFVAARLASQWPQVRDQVADASMGWLAATVALAGAGMTWIAVCWRLALGLSGPRPGRRRTVAWYYAGEIGKYVPGGVWPVLGRGELARRGGVPRGRAYPSVGLSLVALYMAALALVAALAPLDLATRSSSRAPLALLVLLPLGAAALHPRVLGWGRDLLVRLTGRGSEVVVPPWRATAGLVAAYLPAWLLIWAATWCASRALVPDPPLLQVGVATMLSWVAGFAAVPVPAGAGVREAVFVAAAGLEPGIAATVAVGSRLAFLVVDVAGVVLTVPWHRHPDRPVAPGPPAVERTLVP